MNLGPGEYLFVNLRDTNSVCKKIQSGFWTLLGTFLLVWCSRVSTFQTQWERLMMNSHQWPRSKIRVFSFNWVRLNKWSLGDRKISTTEGIVSSSFSEGSVGRCLGKDLPITCFEDVLPWGNRDSKTLFSSRIPGISQMEPFTTWIDRYLVLYVLWGLVTKLNTLLFDV